MLSGKNAVTPVVPRIDDAGKAGVISISDAAAANGAAEQATTLRDESERILFPELGKGADDLEPIALFKLEIQRLAGLDDDLHELSTAVANHRCGQNSASSPFRILELVTSKIGTDTFDEVWRIIERDQPNATCGLRPVVGEIMIEVLRERDMLDDNVIQMMGGAPPPRRKRKAKGKRH